MASTESSAVLTVLGSGTLVPDARRSSASHHLQTDSCSILLDCGSGTLHGLAEHGVDWERLTHIAITHFHPDHISDLAGVILAFKHGTEPPREAPLFLIGPVGLRGVVEALADALGEYLLRPGFPIRIVELDPHGRFEDADGGFVVRCCPTPHTDRSVAFRVDGDWGSVGYTGDTGPSQDVARFMADTSVLVSECTHPDPPAGEVHLTPSGVADMVSVAKPELLVVTHVFPSHTPEEAVSHIASSYDGAAVAADDGMRIRIRRRHVTVDPPGSAL